jgi:hypothetical protein
MQCSADFYHQIADTGLSEAAGVVDNATALDATVNVLDADATAGDTPIRGFLCAREGPAPRLLGRHDDLHLVERECQEAEVLEQPAACGQGVRRGIRHPLVVDTARLGVTQKEDREHRVDQQHMFHRLACFLTTITARLFKRVLGARDAPFRAIVATRGAGDARTGAAAGSSAGGGSSPVGTTRAAASASVTPTRCASSCQERLGASPSVRSVPCSTPNRT